MDALCQFLISICPSYTEAMYEGNEPSCEAGWKMEDGGIATVWRCKYGTGHTYKGKLLTGDFSVDTKIRISIVGSVIHVIDNRYSCQTDEWIYCNCGEPTIHGCAKHRIHRLEDDKLQKILSSKFDCEYWRIIRSRAIELIQKNKQGEHQ